MSRSITLPFSPDELRSLRAGEELLLTGPAFTVRDATCARLLEEARVSGELPYGLAGELICFIGPTPPAAGRPHGAAGPTTARRMDRATLELARYGLTATFGKGERSEVVRHACAEQGMVYLIGIGGAAALAAQHITASEIVAYPDLGPESLRRIELEDFPVIVAYDTQAGDLYARPPINRSEERELGLASPGDTPQPPKRYAIASSPARGEDSPGDASPSSLSSLLSGIFLTFEGGEGCGKSSHMAWLAEVLRQAGRQVLAVREPGATAVGEPIRAVLLDPKNREMAPLTELLLYEAARAQLVAESIRPALESGAVVLCDRFFDSTTAYQGYGRGLDLRQIADLNLVATGGIVPDRTFILEVAAEIGLQRATKATKPDRLEQEAPAFHERVHEGFYAIAAADPVRVRLIDTSGSKPATRAAIARQLVDLLPEMEAEAETQRQAALEVEAALAPEDVDAC
ncbi:MAG: dTMP kinase [Actinomycetia bacterium]|nr:dTMP kinase [Actinomycetes bacterium]